MAKIAKYLFSHSYLFHRAIIIFIIALVHSQLDGRLFDSPDMVGQIIFVIITLVAVSAMFPLLSEIPPMLCNLFRYGFSWPTMDTYQNKCNYILPFTGKWTVHNGGFAAGQFHSWRGSTERHAYDFAIFEMEDGNDDWTPSANVAEYPCYGKDIVAIADGVVIKTINHHPDSRTNGVKGYCDTWEMRGNYIIIKHADGEYSVTAHLKPNSVQIRKGDTVKQGQIIAQCGNSGNSTAPHIHFQLQNSANILTAVSLPIAFTNIDTAYSQAHKEFCEETKRPVAIAGENSKIKNGKTYITRGLDVKNK